MAEAIVVSPPARSLAREIRDFLNARLIHIFAFSLFALLAIFLLYPILAVLVKSFWGEDGFTLEYYAEFFSFNFYYWSFLNTIILGASTMAALIVIGFGFAFLTTRGPVWLRTPLKIVALLPLVAPPYIFAISLITLLGRNGFIHNLLKLDFSIYGWTGTIIAQILAFLPLSFMMIENVLNALNPNLEDSASDMGASEFKIIWFITLPLSAPGLLKAALLVFVMAIAEFGNPAILGGKIPFLAPDTYLMITGEGRFDMASVLSVVLITPCIIIFIIHDYLLKGKGYTTIVGKPVAAEPRKMSALVLTPFLVVCLPVAIMVLASFAVIFIGSVVKIVGVDNTVDWSHMANLQSNLAIYNSVKVSLAAGLFGAVVGTLLSYVIMRGNFPGKKLMEVLALSGFALPGTVIGVGYIIAFNRPPFLLTGTIWIIILNCVFRFVAVGVEAGISKLHQISIEIEEAAADLGADFVTTFFKIVLPIMFSAFIAGFIYTFMTTLMSLSSVIFLVTPGFDLASVYIYLAAQLGEMGVASATTVKLIAIVAVSMALLKVLARKTGLDVTKKV
ncbi:MAG: iron ABC transporter permease [Thermodesulfobacteriota bacterium]